MATTVQDIIDGAMAKSTKNQPGTVGTDAIELKNEVQRILQGAFAVAAVVNPTRFGITEDIVGVAGLWARPEAAEAIVRIESATFVEVVVVPYDDRLADDPKPSLYEFGGGFRADPAQTAPPGDADTLTFWYSKRPDQPQPDDETGTLDGVWPDAYNEILMLQLAIYLSRKDGREEEVQGYLPDRNGWLQRYVSWLQRGTANERRRFGGRKVFNVETLIPLFGGS